MLQLSLKWKHYKVSERMREMELSLQTTESHSLVFSMCEMGLKEVTCLSSFSAVQCFVIWRGFNGLTKVGNCSLCSFYNVHVSISCNICAITSFEIWFLMMSNKILLLLLWTMQQTICLLKSLSFLLSVVVVSKRNLWFNLLEIIGGRSTDVVLWKELAVVHVLVQVFCCNYFPLRYVDDATV